MAITVTHPFVSAISDDPAAVAAGQVVPSNWNATHSISGTLDVANGGTGTTTSTGTGSVVLSSSPTLTTPDLGTPSAIVLTNASGTASININGTVGATTPSTGAFTTLSSTGNTTLGSVGVGITPISSTGIVLGKNITGGANAYGVYVNSSVQSDVTSSAQIFSSYPTTQATTFTLGSLIHYAANQNTLGAGATITNQIGFYAFSGLTGATNNFGFYSNLASATGRWNFYAAGTAANYFAGNTGIGGLPTTDTFRVTGTASGATIFNGQIIDQTIGSGVTSSYRGLLVRPIMQDAAFTLSTLYHVYVNPQAKPATPTLSNQYGFMAESTLTAATSNYGFFGNIAASTGRWNFYGGGTASNHFSGTVSIGVPAVTYGLEVNRNLSGAVERYQVLVSGEIQSDVTTLATGVYVLPSINNSSFTLATYRGFQAGTFNISGAATISNYHGFFAGGTTQSNITTAYGYTSNLAASGSSRWNFYAGGTAPNYFAGNSTFNTGLTVNGTTNLSALTASTALALDASKNVVSVTNTGSGNNVLATSPVLTTPNLGTPSAVTLTNATGLPVATGISGLGTGVATFLATPSSANLAAAVTNETGSGSLVFANNPTLLNVAVGLTSGTTAVVVGGTESASGGNPRFSFYDLMTLSSGATVSHSSFYSYPQTVAATFTLPNHYSFYAEGIAVNTGVTVTNQYSVYINSTANAATNNYGVYSNIASAANRWNFYAAGTAANYFAGNTYIAGTTGDQALNVNGAVRVAATTTANQTSAGTMDFTSGAMRFLVWGASGTQGNFSWWTGSGALGATQRMTLTGSNNLGLATSTFGTNATNTLSIASGTAPASGVADTVQYYSMDLSAGNTMPAFYTEGTNVGTGTPTANRTIAVNFNGTTYYLLASTTA